MHISTYHASQQKAHSKDRWGYRTIVVHDPCVVLGREAIHFPKISSLEPRPWTPPYHQSKEMLHVQHHQTFKLLLPTLLSLL